jgi:hypothetical protein
VNEYFFTTNFHIFTTGGEFSVVKTVKIGGKKMHHAGREDREGSEGGREHK